MLKEEIFSISQYDKKKVKLTEIKLESSKEFLNLVQTCTVLDIYLV